MEDLADGRFYQLRADQQDHRRHGQPRQVFDPVVAEGVPFVGGLRREAEADQRHDGAGRVGEVVDRIRRDGDAAGQRTEQEFPDKQQHVAHDAHDPGQPSICFAHRGVFGILRVADQPPHQKFRHRFMSSVGLAMDFCSIRMSLPLNL